MERINKLLQSRLYKKYIEKNSKREKRRRFCKHDMTHFLEVARVMYILSLEKSTQFKKDVIYATALLHDIGRWKQYKTGEDHAIVGSELCVEILEESDFIDDEIKEISKAILLHRKGGQEVPSLGWLLYEADKKSRLCFTCDAVKKCNRFDEDNKPKLLY